MRHVASRALQASGRWVRQGQPLLRNRNRGPEGELDLTAQVEHRDQTPGSQARLSELDGEHIYLSSRGEDDISPGASRTPGVGVALPLFLQP